MNHLRNYLQWYQTAPTWLVYAMRDQAEEVRGQKSDVSNFPVPVLGEPKHCEANAKALPSGSGEARESTRLPAIAGRSNSRGGRNAGDNTPATLYEKTTSQDEASKRKALRSIHRNQTEATKPQAVESHAQKSDTVGSTDSSAQGQTTQAEQVPTMLAEQTSVDDTRTPSELRQSARSGVGLSGLPQQDSSAIGGGGNSLSGNASLAKEPLRSVLSYHKNDSNGVPALSAQTSETLREWTERKLFWAWWDRNH